MVNNQPFENLKIFKAFDLVTEFLEYIIAFLIIIKSV